MWVRPDHPAPEAAGNPRHALNASVEREGDIGCPKLKRPCRSTLWMPCTAAKRSRKQLCRRAIVRVRGRRRKDPRHCASKVELPGFLPACPRARTIGEGGRCRTCPLVGSTVGLGTKARLDASGNGRGNRHAQSAPMRCEDANRHVAPSGKTAEAPKTRPGAVSANPAVTWPNAT